MHTFKAGDLVAVKVKPKAKVNAIDFTQDPILVQVQAPATDSLANEAVVRLFKTQLRLKVELVSGHTSRFKRVRVIG